MNEKVGGREPHTEAQNGIIETRHASLRINKQTKKGYINQFEVVRRIGEGSYGFVCLCHDTQKDMKEVAVKVLEQKKLRGKANEAEFKEVMDDIKREIAIMKKLDHPNVVKLYEVINDAETGNLYLIMEYLPGGPCFKRKTKPLDEEVARNYVRQIAMGLEYCHKNGVIHHDIKPDNLLIAKDGSVKICDFGVSMLHKIGDDRSTVVRGTPPFLAPEMVSFRSTDEPYAGRPIDIWALGIVLYMFIFGDAPFKGSSVRETFEQILTSPIVFHTPISPILEHFFRRILDKNPTTRITMDEMKHHPWLTKNGTDPFPIQPYVLHLTNSDFYSALTPLSDFHLLSSVRLNASQKANENNQNLNEKRSQSNLHLFSPLPSAISPPPFLPSSSTLSMSFVSLGSPVPSPPPSRPPSCCTSPVSLYFSPSYQDIHTHSHSVSPIPNNPLSPSRLTRPLSPPISPINVLSQCCFSASVLPSLTSSSSSTQLTMPQFCKSLQDLPKSPKQVAPSEPAKSIALKQQAHSLQAKMQSQTHNSQQQQQQQPQQQQSPQHKNQPSFQSQELRPHSLSLQFQGCHQFISEFSPRTPLTPSGDKSLLTLQNLSTTSLSTPHPQTQVSLSQLTSPTQSVSAFVFPRQPSSALPLTPIPHSNVSSAAGIRPPKQNPLHFVSTPTLVSSSVITSPSSSSQSMSTSSLLLHSAFPLSSSTSQFPNMSSFHPSDSNFPSPHSLLGADKDQNSRSVSMLTTQKPSTLLPSPMLDPCDDLVTLDIFCPSLLIPQSQSRCVSSDSLTAATTRTGANEKEKQKNFINDSFNDAQCVCSSEIAISAFDIDENEPAVSEDVEVAHLSSISGCDGVKASLSSPLTSQQDNSNARSCCSGEQNTNNLIENDFEEAKDKPIPPKSTPELGSSYSIPVTSHSFSVNSHNADATNESLMLKLPSSRQPRSSSVTASNSEKSYKLPNRIASSRMKVSGNQLHYFHEPAHSLDFGAPQNSSSSSSSSSSASSSSLSSSNSLQHSPISSSLSKPRNSEASPFLDKCNTSTPVFGPQYQSRQWTDSPLLNPSSSFFAPIHSRASITRGSTASSASTNSTSNSLSASALPISAHNLQMGSLSVSSLIQPRNPKEAFTTSPSASPAVTTNSTTTNSASSSFFTPVPPPSNTTSSAPVHLSSTNFASLSPSNSVGNCNNSTSQSPFYTSASEIPLPSDLPLIATAAADSGNISLPQLPSSTSTTKAALESKTFASLNLQAQSSLSFSPFYLGLSPAHHRNYNSLFDIKLPSLSEQSSGHASPAPSSSQSLQALPSSDEPTPNSRPSNTDGQTSPNTGTLSASIDAIALTGMAHQPSTLNILSPSLSSNRDSSQFDFNCSSLLSPIAYFSKRFISQTDVRQFFNTSTMTLPELFEAPDTYNTEPHDEESSNNKHQTNTEVVLQAEYANEKALVSQSSSISSVQINSASGKHNITQASNDESSTFTPIFSLSPYSSQTLQRQMILNEVMDRDDVEKALEMEESYDSFDDNDEMKFKTAEILQVAQKEEHAEKSLTSGETKCTHDETEPDAEQKEPSETEEMESSEVSIEEYGDSSSFTESASTSEKIITKTSESNCNATNQLKDEVKDPEKTSNDAHLEYTSKDIQTVETISVDGAYNQIHEKHSSSCCNIL